MIVLISKRKSLYKNSYDSERVQNLDLISLLFNYFILLFLSMESLGFFLVSLSSLIYYAITEYLQAKKTYPKHIRAFSSQNKIVSNKEIVCHHSLEVNSLEALHCQSHGITVTDNLPSSRQIWVRNTTPSCLFTNSILK